LILHDFFFCFSSLFGAVKELRFSTLGVVSGSEVDVVGS